MIAKLAALAAPFLLSNAAPAPEAVWVNYPSVAQVFCDDGRGTAVRVSRNRYLSVHHVTNLSGCSIEGKPFKIVEGNGEQDFSILSVEFNGVSSRINCGGFKAGEWYYSVGYANGIPSQRLIVLKGVGHNGKWSVFTGAETVIPGMSGGPVFNRHGEIVGMVNAYNPFFGLSFSRSLSETSACQKG